MSDPFWYDNWEILISENRLTDFIPSASMTFNEKLNAISRFLAYLAIALTVYFENTKYLGIAVLGLGVVYLIYHKASKSGIAEQSGGSPYPCRDNICDPLQRNTFNDTELFQKPTQENPFMNVLLTDYVNNPTRPPAANVSDPSVAKQTEQYFNHNLYNDVDDIWGKSNSQRQYYTNPITTIPNDRDSFMKWCYDTPYVCKDGDLTACLKYEDPRASGKL